jgi:glycosyltransferase involved in cell wall biosynthesis
MSTPRYSVLLPTRNGGAQLEGCIRSVLEADRDDVELVVSDNASDDETPEIIARFAGDERLTALRQASPIEVSENWNACLERSRGERILLLGDDDRLLPDYFARADALLERWEEPDCLLYNGFAYASPGFVGSSHSYYADPFYVADDRLPKDGTFTESQRRAVLAAMFRFRFPVHLNMQTALVTRAAVDRLRAGLFKPPFPDFYGLAALMLVAERWVLSSERLVVVGVSPKSFGRTIHSPRQQAAGLEYLGIAPTFPGKLPGSEIFNGHYETLLALLSDYPGELAGMEIDRGEYVISQANTWWVQLRLGTLRGRELLARLRMLSGTDAARLLRALLPRLRPAAVARQLRAGQGETVPGLWPGMRPVPEVADLDEFRAWIAERRAPSPIGR